MWSALVVRVSDCDKQVMQFWKWNFCTKTCSIELCAFFDVWCQKKTNWPVIWTQRLCRTWRSCSLSVCHCSMSNVDGDTTPFRFLKFDDVICARCAGFWLWQTGDAILKIKFAKVNSKNFLCDKHSKKNAALDHSKTMQGHTLKCKLIRHPPN